MSDYMCGNCMKCLIIFLNVLAMLVSFAMINIGAIVIWNRELVKSVVGPFLNNLATGAVPLTERQVSDIAGEFHNLIGVLGWAPFIFGFFIFAASVLALVGICRPSTDVLLALSEPGQQNESQSNLQCSHAVSLKSWVRKPLSITATETRYCLYVA